MPDYHQLTLSIPSSSLTLVCYRGNNGEPVAQRATIGGYRTNGKTRAGATRLVRDRPAPYFIWSGKLLVKAADLSMLEAIAAILQGNPTVQCVLRDEFYRVNIAQGTAHDRAVVSGSTKTLTNGLQVVFCDFNVFLTLPDSGHVTPLGSGWYAARFEAEELI